MDFYLIDAGTGFLHLPVNPSEVTISRDKMLETLTILNLGEADFTVGEKLKEISFSSFFPRDYDTYCQYAEIPDPQEAMNTLTLWTHSRRPVRLIITETIINTLVLVTAHVSQFKGGEPGDVYFDFTARTWRQVGVRTAPLVPAGLLATESRPDMETVSVETRGLRPDQRPQALTYTVLPGDSLWEIAGRMLGDSSRWEDIYELNRGLIGANPSVIVPGMVLALPAA
jgi:nucleoid-associated protein YgaU